MFRVIRVEKKFCHWLIDKKNTISNKSDCYSWSDTWKSIAFRASNYKTWYLIENSINTHFILIECGVQIENKSELNQKTQILGLLSPITRLMHFSFYHMFWCHLKTGYFVLNSMHMEQQFLLWSLRVNLPGFSHAHSLPHLSSRQAVIKQVRQPMEPQSGLCS